MRQSPISASILSLSTRKTFARISACVALMSILSLATVANAAPLVAGQTIYPAPGEPDPVGGQVACGPLVQHFTTANFSGNLTSTVIVGDVSNPYGGLTFTYVVSNDPTSTNTQARLSINGYAGFLTDASYQSPTADVRPTLVDRSASSDVVGYSFLGAPAGFGPIAPGQQSALLVVQTNATTCANSFASVIDGAIATIPTYAPAPEPASLALLGLAAISLIRRRR
jgi:PEP-CTERM motif